MLPIWLQQLQHEHELILRALDILEQESSQPMPSKSKLYETLRLLLDYGDSIHNTKEENHLFPTLVEKGMPHQGPIHQMIMDHEAERELLIKWVHTLSEHANTVESTFYSRLGEYIESRREHIRTENEQLYARATTFLTPSDEDKLLQAFKHIEIKMFGEGVQAHYEKRLQEGEQEKVGRHPLFAATIQTTLDHLTTKALLLDSEGIILYSNLPDPIFHPGASLQIFFRSPISDSILNRFASIRQGHRLRPLAYTRDGVRYVLQFVPIISLETDDRGLLVLIEEFDNLKNAEHLKSNSPGL